MLFFIATLAFVEFVLMTVVFVGFICELFEVVAAGLLIGLNSSQLPLGGAIGPGPNI